MGNFHATIINTLCMEQPKTILLRKIDSALIDYNVALQEQGIMWQHERYASYIQLIV